MKNYALNTTAKELWIVSDSEPTKKYPIDIFNMAKDIHEVHKILRTKEFYDLCVEYVGLPFHVEIIRKAEYLVKKKERKYAIK